MSAELWANERMSVSAEFGFDGISLGVYDPSGNVLAVMRGPTIGLAGTNPLELKDATGAPILGLNLAPNRLAQRHFGRILTVDWPDGSRAGTVYLHTLTRRVT